MQCLVPAPHRGFIAHLPGTICFGYLTRLYRYLAPCSRYNTAYCMPAFKLLQAYTILFYIVHIFISIIKLLYQDCKTTKTLYTIINCYYLKILSKNLISLFIPTFISFLMLKSYNTYFILFIQFLCYKFFVYGLKYTIFILFLNYFS